MSHFSTVKAFVIRRKYYVLGALAVILIGGIAIAASGGSTPAETTKQTREVTVARVADILSGGSSLSLVAEIASVNEAKISAESGGRIVRVHAKLGDTVGAGKILAEIENASQRAAVLQAEGSLDAAKAALQKVQGGTREEQLAILQSAKNTADTGAVNTLLSAYGTADAVIRDTADQMFSNPESSPQLNITTADSQAKIDAQNMRSRMSAILARQKGKAGSLSVSADLKAEIATTEAELREMRTFYDALVRALNAAVSSPSISDTTIATYKGEATAGRASLVTALSSLSSARSALEVAEKNLEQGVFGAQAEDVAATEAQLKQVQGAYNASLAALEKTIIRSPISGTLNNFTVKLGDFVSPTQQVAVVSNNGSLEAIAYVSEEDRNRISVGDKVTLEVDIVGTVTRIAPALDPVTRRIEIRIGLPGSATNKLTNGQSVRVTFASHTAPAKPASGPLSIPITALKMEADRTIVFVVENSKLIARPITIGKLSGEFVQVTEGLTLDTAIVVDARGLKEGTEVVVK